VKHPTHQDGLNPNDFRPMESEVIPFNLEFDEIKFSGTLTPSSEKLPFGIHMGFVVRIPGKEAMNITIHESEWVMPGAPKKFVEALGEWIESYYE